MVPLGSPDLHLRTIELVNFFVFVLLIAMKNAYANYSYIIGLLTRCCFVYILPPLIFFKYWYFIEP